MNMYNTCKAIIIIIISAVIIAGPLSARKESPKQQLARARRQLTQYEEEIPLYSQQLSLCRKQLSLCRQELKKNEPYKLLALGLLKRSTQLFSSDVKTFTNTENTENEDFENEDSDDNNDT